MSPALLTSELKERWSTEGWCVVPELIPPAQLAAAQDAVHRYFPTPAEMLEHGGAEAGEWECRSCARSFSLKFVAVVRPRPHDAAVRTAP